jgi:transketolase
MATNEKTQMRDAVLDRLYDLSGEDKDIVFVVADMGAKALDRIRAERASQVVQVGIAEENMVGIAAGLASEGKKPFTYCIAAFATNRAHEFHRLNGGLMGQPYNVIGVGPGFGYPDSGPTHYLTDDLAGMNSIPKFEIYNPSDSLMAEKLTDIALNSENPTYLRLEREVLPMLSKSTDSFEEGFREVNKGEDVAIVSTGYMLHKALEVKDRLWEKGLNPGVIDVYRLKPINEKGLADTISKYKEIVSLEEHFVDGGLGGILSGLITDRRLDSGLTRMGVPKEYVYLYGRENIHKEIGIDVDSVSNEVEQRFSRAKSI